MKTFLPLVCVALLAVTSPSFADDTSEHASHHPAATVAQPEKGIASDTQKETQGSMGMMDMQMKAMRDMHEKMMAAKTPEERSAMMPEHMKMMHDGMAMMNGTNGMNGGELSGKKHMPPKMMQKNIEMMQMMMQMMMDHMETSHMSMQAMPK